MPSDLIINDPYSGTPCASCKHYFGNMKCAAFLERIPDEILSGVNQHRKPVKGDNGITYAPLPKEVKK